MTLVELIVYCVIAGICGAIARAFVGGSRGGFVISLLVGFVGAFIGTWLARQLHLPELLVVKVEGRPFPIVWSIVGGIVLVLAAHGLMRPGYASRFVR
jgi:uncharacterized membrane protein YeaQ/YmgE (transglycosylase-associated protein family)